VVSRPYNILLPKGDKMSTVQQYVTPEVVAPPVRLVAVPERTCTWCKEAIKKDALVCPHCRREQRGAGLAGMIPKSLLSPGMAALGAVLLSVAVFVSVFAAISLNRILDERVSGHTFDEVSKSMLNYGSNPSEETSSPSDKNVPGRSPDGEFESITSFSERALKNTKIYDPPEFR